MLGKERLGESAGGGARWQAGKRANGGRREASKPERLKNEGARGRGACRRTWLGLVVSFQWS